jgi:hypothetical protein
MFPPEKEMQTGSIKKPFSRIFLMLAAPIYHARWLAAPVHWCVIKAIEMLAAHCLFETNIQLVTQSF